MFEPYVYMPSSIICTASFYLARILSNANIWADVCYPECLNIEAQRELCPHGSQCF